MENLREVLEEQGVPSDKIDEIIIATKEDKTKKSDTVQVEDLDTLIDNEDDPLKRAKIVARKISGKLERAEY